MQLQKIYIFFENVRVMKSLISRGHSTFDLRKKAIFVNYLINTLLKYIKKFFSFISYTFYTQKRESNATPRKVDRFSTLMEF